MKHAVVALCTSVLALNAAAQSATDEIAKYREMIARRQPRRAVRSQG